MIKITGYILIGLYFIVLGLDVLFQSKIIQIYSFQYLIIAGIVIICYSYLKEIVKNNNDQ